jgi:hypothetical protein
MLLPRVYVLFVMEIQTRLILGEWHLRRVAGDLPGARPGDRSGCSSLAAVN